MINWVRRILIVAVFILVSIIFNFDMWREISGGEVRAGVATDGTITEFIVENGLQKILTGESPYERNNQVIYPFGINYAINDPGLSFSMQFLFLRPFFSIHRSMLIILLFNIFLSNILMYMLLRKIYIGRDLSVIGGLVFGFTPFLSQRLLGHYQYTSIYVLPLIYILFYSFFTAKQKKVKLIISIGIGLTLAWILQTNFYYFLMICISLVLCFTWYFFANYQIVIQKIREYVLFSLMAIITFVIGIAPWIVAVKNSLFFDGRVNTPGLGGAINLSADIINFVTPNEYNPFYKLFFDYISKSFPITASFNYFYLHTQDHFMYPGLLILSTVVLIIVLWKKLPSKLKKSILPLSLMSLFFAILTLGPYLKIAGRWSINLDGVAAVFPLPFLLFHYIPGLNSIRVPVRFVPGAIFFSCISGVLLAQYYFTKLSRVKRKYILISIFLIFVVDQCYVLPPPIPRSIPKNIYSQMIDKPTTVMDIPYTLRDGFNYLGFVHAIGPMQGALIHHQPIIGGYFARVPETVFSYYRQLPFLNYIAQITDRGNYNPLYESPKDPVLKPYPGTMIDTQEELDFLGIGSFVVKIDEPYSLLVTNLLTQIGASKGMVDGSYQLYTRQIGTSHKFNDIQLGGLKDYLYVGQGFGPEPGEYRKMIDSRARIFIRRSDNEQKLIVTASSPNKQIIEIYINEQKLGVITTKEDKNDFEFDVEGRLLDGINTIFFNLITSKKDQKLGGVDIYRVHLE